MYRRYTNRKPSETRRLRLLRHCRRVASARVATSVNVVERGLRLNKVIGAFAPRVPWFSVLWRSCLRFLEQPLNEWPSMAQVCFV